MASPRPSLSFELFPPRSAASEDALLHTIEQIAPTRPDYVSVTAAVDGQRRRRSLDLLEHLVQHTELPPLAHIIATGRTAGELRELTEQIIDLGVRGFLALRGDRPEGHRLQQEELPFGRHLVELIRQVERGCRARLGAGRLAVGVAAYPVRHPESPSEYHDIEVLLAKQQAGADFAITQLYPQSGNYRALLQRAENTGVDLPVIPGIFAVTSLSRYERVCRLAGFAPDPGFAYRLETAESERERRRVGVEQAHHLAADALEAGAPGVHLYTFNEHPAALELLERLDLPGHPVPAAAPHPHPSSHREEITMTTQTLHSAPAPFPSATVLGYPRIGPQRELKRALEAHWAGESSEQQRDQQVTRLREQLVRRQRDLGLREPSAVPASFALYDQVLDTLLALSALPERFRDLADEHGFLDRDGSFILARGDQSRGPLEMTKWFDTNYHYLVPEIGPETRFAAHPQELLGQLAACGEGPRLRPVLVGPLTFLLLAKSAPEAPEGFAPIDRLAALLPIYQQLLERLGQAGADWVQLDEPILCADVEGISPDELAGLVRTAYSTLSARNLSGTRRSADEAGEGTDTTESRPPRPQLLVTTPYGDAEELLPVLAETGVEAVHVDLVSGRSGLRRLTEQQLAAFQGENAPVLVAGVVDGRNIWRTDLTDALHVLEDLQAAGLRVAVSTSTSLQHVPHDLDLEGSLPERPRRWLAFADQKIREVSTLAAGLTHGAHAIAAELSEARAALACRADSFRTQDAQVRRRAASLSPEDWTREPAEQRAREQAAAGPAAALPPLPSTTIGSFPQTPKIRALRAEHRAGRIGEQEYEEGLREQIRQIIEIQERLGLDVLVHGEPERNDMVQYFAEHFEGFDTTEHGWVQSYGSRCTRPSILWGDVCREGQGLRGEAFTVPWIGYAQSLTSRPVKGMLTGPVTILAWSFVREDQPLARTAEQVALALRDEVEDLEAAGIGIIQVDEPALRELLPLRRRDRAEYLDWSVRAFRIATSSVAASTQIHTHLCYSEFNQVLSAIDALDADVTSVEAARSRMELLEPLEESGFARGIGPGVWDIHSPRVPTVEEIRQLLERAAQVVPCRKLWANPDCGLKTRAYPETLAALGNLVAAAAQVRSETDSEAGASAGQPCETDAALSCSGGA